MEAVCNNQKIEILVDKITQTNNNTGLILIGFYSIKYYAWSKEGGWLVYESKNQRLSIYNNKPLTDQLVTGTFSADVSADGFQTESRIVNGTFQLSF